MTKELKENIVLMIEQLRKFNRKMEIKKEPNENSRSEK